MRAPARPRACRPIPIVDRAPRGARGRVARRLEEVLPRRCGSDAASSSGRAGSAPPAARGRSGDRHRSGARVRHRRSRLDAAGDRDGRGAGGRATVERFLDLGCGSGILSIAAALLWPAARGLALDVDPEAVATADENLALNRVTTVAARVGSLGDVAGAANDLVLANIEADVLVPLAPEFPARLAPGGALDPLGAARQRRRRGDARLSRRRIRASTRAATRTSGRRCACVAAAEPAMSRGGGCSFRPTRLRATRHHRQRRRAPSPGARAARAAGRRDHAVRRRRRRGGGARRARRARRDRAGARVGEPARPGAAPRRVGRADRAADRGAARRAHGLARAEDARELGVSRIVPVITARSVARPEPGAARALGEDRARGGPPVRAGRRAGGRRARDARGGAGGARPAGAAARAVREGERGRPLRALLPESRRAPTALLVGPEGGLAAAEVRGRAGGRLRAGRASGPRILRVETAAIVAVALAAGRRSAGDLELKR